MSWRGTKKKENHLNAISKMMDTFLQARLYTFKRRRLYSESDLKTSQTSPRDKNGKNYVLQNNSTGPTKVFVASLDCLTNGWISLNHRHSIESNGCFSKVQCHPIGTIGYFSTIETFGFNGSLDQQLATIENHRHSIKSKGCHSMVFTMVQV